MSLAQTEWNPPATVHDVQWGGDMRLEVLVMDPPRRPWPSFRVDVKGKQRYIDDVIPFGWWNVVGDLDDRVVFTLVWDGQITEDNPRRLIAFDFMNFPDAEPDRTTVLESSTVGLIALDDRTRRLWTLSSHGREGETQLWREEIVLHEYHREEDGRLRIEQQDSMFLRLQRSVTPQQFRAVDGGLLVMTALNTLERRRTWQATLIRVVEGGAEPSGLEVKQQWIGQTLRSITSFFPLDGTVEGRWCVSESHSNDDSDLIKREIVVGTLDEIAAGGGRRIRREPDTVYRIAPIAGRASVLVAEDAGLFEWDGENALHRLGSLEDIVSLQRLGARQTTNCVIEVWYTRQGDASPVILQFVDSNNPSK